MDVNEVLQFVDQLIFEQTGKHLDDVQKAVVEGTWSRQTYEAIAQKCHVTKNYASDVGAELWQLLSEALGEDVKKSNFRSTFERLQITSSPIIIQNKHRNNHNYNFCLQTFNLLEQQLTKTKTEPISLNHDLTLAPQVINFYNRESELTTLHNYIFNQNTRLISVLGLSGIGKTTLIKRFIDLNLQQFEVIIWRSLQFPKSLDLLLNDLLNSCQQEAKETTDDQLKQLLDFLTEKKSLIILDDVQNIFITGQFAGQYQNQYQDYKNLFKMITETIHQSHVILISQEQCAEMHCLDEELYPIKCLELSGIDDVDILKNLELKDEESGLQLIRLYEGNPLYLKNIANSIKNIFDGHVADFLAENELILTKDIQTNLQFSLSKLSPIEQQIIFKLSHFDHPLSREELKTNLELSSTDFINGLESLQQRYLVAKIKGDKIMFKLFPLFQEYVKNYCQE